MSCNCKTIHSGKDIEDVIIGKVENEKLTFFKKLKIAYLFSEFYFYFVVTSLINFMANDKLEPSLPKRLIRKYSRR